MNEKKNLQEMRHSLAHLLAAAVLELYPNALPAIGPAIENGFYYDFEFVSPIGKDDLPKVEKKMREILKGWKGFSHHEVLENEAKKIFKNNKYKLELIEEIAAKKEKITLYKSGDFEDLCRGGHVEDIKDLNPEAFVLSHTAGAYWRGSEKNKMLTRIYALAFSTKQELDEYEAMLEEAKKRDHRILGEKLGLFMISDEVGKGLPLWLPNGAFVRKKLEDFIYEKESAHGYKYIYTPILTNKRLYEQSGHLTHYREDMYSPIEIEGEEYYLRPMNCPHHHQIFKHQPLSYRDLPLRLAEHGLVHRFERSGVLTGLIRARCFTQNDAHIYSAKSDLKKELLKVLKLFHEVYNDVFGIKDYWFRLSLPDFSNKEKFGDIENNATWEEASKIARETLEEFGAKYVEGGGEAAFYGPKIDVQIKNVNGKEDTIATIQIDFYSAKRFGLDFINADGQKEEPVIIHRAIMGSFERFFAFITEHYGGAFPLWLSPVQVKVITIGESHHAYGVKIFETLKEEGVKAELDLNNESLGKKIREAKIQKIPYLIVIGDKEVDSETLSVESRNEGNIGSLKIEDFISKIKKEIAEKK